MKNNEACYEGKKKVILHDKLSVQTLRYFPLCLAGFSPCNFLSNFPPLAVEVAAIPAMFPSSSLETFFGTAPLPVIGKAVAAS